MTVAPVAAVLDYDAGNVRSAKRGLEAAGARAIVTSDAAEAQRADVLVIPGVGHFGSCLARLRAGGLVDVVRGFIDDARPVLGICVGMQLLYATSEEAEEPGLGLLPGRVVRFPSDAVVPHMGWDVIVPVDGHADDRLLAGISGERAYFAHSYFAVPADPTHVVADCDYGGRGFPCIVREGSVVGTQFHPEKSGRVGARLLENWLAGLA
ncbi:MAG: imidazole glycerol phosphate synthase subunit HisH [Actinomycetota bacterium]